MNPVIYCYTDLENGKRYVGQTRYPEERDKQHRSCLDGGWHYKLHTHPELFKYEILECCDEDELNDREKYWIDYYDSFNNGYNKTPGGGCNPNNKKPVGTEYTDSGYTEMRKLFLHYKKFFTYEENDLLQIDLVSLDFDSYVRFGNYLCKKYGLPKPELTRKQKYFLNNS